MAVFFVAMGASRLSSRISPRLLVQIGLLAVAAGALVLLSAIEASFDSLRFAAAVFVIGVGLGLIASQLTNGNLTSVGAEKTSEVGALQGTSQNLGSAVIGSLLLGLLTATFDHRVEENEALPYGPRHEVAGVAAIALLGLGATRRLPADPLRGPPPTVTA
jgi:MFS family permease